MNTDKYNDAWTKLLSARRRGVFSEIREATENLLTEVRALEREQTAVSRAYICNHTPDRYGVCTRCGYNARQWPAGSSQDRPNRPEDNLPPPPTH
jgi:hypothetical protein